MQPVSLKKVILPGTWRYLGQLCPDVKPSSIPIAGRDPLQIANAIGGNLYRIGRFQKRNAFLVIKDRAHFLYVRPNYSSYRKVACRVFSKVSWKVDYDHALSRRIANVAQTAYEYVLLLRIQPTVNRSHGHYEKKDQLSKKAPNLCFADNRVFDKWLGARPLDRFPKPESLAGYSHKNVISCGLTLKQKGVWAYAIGMGEKRLNMDILKPF